MTLARLTTIVRIALAIGFCVDFFVGLLSIVAPQLITPLFDIPMHDATLARLAGGEFVVAALVYAIAFGDPRRFRVLLWLCALDQLFAVVMPALAVSNGTLPHTWKIIAPIPLQAILALLFVFYASRPGRRRAVTHFE